jgi:hypothetical protein
MYGRPILLIAVDYRMLIVLSELIFLTVFIFLLVFTDCTMVKSVAFARFHRAPVASARKHKCV